MAKNDSADSQSEDFFADKTGDEDDEESHDDEVQLEEWTRAGEDTEFFKVRDLHVWRFSSQICDPRFQTQRTQIGGVSLELYFLIVSTVWFWRRFS